MRGLVLVLAMPVLLALAVAWLVLTEAGLRSAANLAASLSGGRVVLEFPSGRIAGPLRVQRVRVNLPDVQVHVHGLMLAWQPAALVRGHADISELSADQVEILVRSDGTAPVKAPDSLVLPLSLAVQSLRVGLLAVRDWDADAAQPARFQLSALAARVESDGRHHRVQSLDAVLPFGRASLAGDIDATSPFALAASGALSGTREARDYALKLAATGNLLTPQLRVEAQGAGLSGSADVTATPFAAVPLSRLKIALGDLDPSAFQPSAPHAALNFEADLQSEAGPDGIGWGLTGPFAVGNRSPNTLDRKGLPFSRLNAHLHWTPRQFRVDALVLELAGKGRVTGEVDWRPAEVAHVPKAQQTDAMVAAPQAARDGAAFDGFGSLSATLALVAVELHRLDARLPPSILAGQISAQGDAKRQTAELELRVGAARFRGKAAMTAGGEAGVRGLVASGELSELDPHAFRVDAPSARLNADFRVGAVLAASPRVDLTLKLRPSSVQGRPVRGDVRAVIEAQRLVDGVADLDVAGNRVQLKGAWGRAQDVLHFDIDAPALMALGDGLGGRARLLGSVSGTFAAPAGNLQVFAESLRLPGGWRVAGLNADARLGAGDDGVVRIALGLSGLGPTAVAAGAVKGQAWVDQATLSVSGTRRHHVIEIAARGLERESVRARLEGGLFTAVPATAAQRKGEPGRADGLAAAQWQGSIAALETAGRFAARLTAPTALTLETRRVVLAPAVVDAGTRGRIRLDETLWSPQRIATRGSLTGLAVGLFAGAESGPGGRPEGKPRLGPGALQLGAEWDLNLGEHAQGAARLFREAGDLTVSGGIPARLGLQHFELRVGAHDNRLALALEARGTELGELAGSASAVAERTAEGRWRLAPDAALLGSARLTMPSISWIGRLMQEHIVTGGALDATLSLAGTPAAPRASGRIEGHALSLALVDQGLHLSGGELLAEFDRDRLRLTRLEFASPNRVKPNDGRLPVARLTREPGRLSAVGEVALASGAGQFRFDAERLPILQRSDRWLMLSGEGTATSTWTSVDLAADLRADAGFVEMADTPPPSLSDDVVILGRDERSVRSGMKLAASVNVALGDHFYISALGVNTRLTGALRVRLRDGQAPYAVGSIATAEGSYRGYGQHLTLERGRINFQGSLENPGLNVTALRKGLAVEAGIEIGGSARRPRVRLVSQPNVPDPEKLSWIVLGRAPSAGAGADLGLLLPAAQALLGGPGGGMTEQLSRSLGFDELSIGQGALGGVTRSATSRVVGEGTIASASDNVGGQVLTLGKRLSADLFLSFEQSLAGAQSLVKLTYQLTRQVSVVVRGGSDNAADIYYTISFE